MIATGLASSELRAGEMASLSMVQADIPNELVVDIHLLGDGTVLADLLLVHYDLFDKLVEDVGVELLGVGILPDQGGASTLS